MHYIVFDELESEDVKPVMEQFNFNKKSENLGVLVGFSDNITVLRVKQVSLVKMRLKFLSSMMMVTSSVLKGWLPHVNRRKKLSLIMRYRQILFFYFFIF